MTRTETLAAIAALPVSDAVKQHATRLIEGLPEWCPMPESIAGASDGDDDGFLVITWKKPIQADLPTVAVESTINVTGVHSLWRFRVKGGWALEDYTTDRLHELLRQFTGMVALTGGG